MQIQSQTPAADVTQLTGTTSATTKPAANPSVDGLANENTFLQLLVAQIKNQDPLQPADSIQFLSQLAQFSQLEQLIGIRQELTPTSSASSSGSSSGSPTDQNGGTSGTTGTTN
ncbi:MAG: flagellar hook capping protein [Bryobacterales bacterium]|nr:flagellar hook capping protein [Bryobacterales bacterium]